MAACNGGYSKKSNWNTDLNNVARQQVDSQFSSGGYFGDDIDVTATMHINDLLEDAFQTQQVDLSGDTQSVDLFEETQLVDLAGGTQLIELAGETQDLNDVDHVTNAEMICLQDISHFNEHEGTDKIKVVFDTCKLHQDCSLKANNVFCNQGDSVSRTPSDIFSIGEHHSEPAVGGFTSICTATVGTSGLAVHARGVKLCSNTCEKSPLEQLEIEKQGTSHGGNLFNYNSKHKEECLFYGLNEGDKARNLSKLKTSSISKLSAEDRVDGIGQSKVYNNHTDENPDIPEFRNSENLAGLSYANSEEPGELSQAIALEVVDRFLDHNVMDCDQGLVCGFHFVKETNAVNGSKGSRNLAKSSILKSTDGKCRAYDWDDTCENGSGGDFFERNKQFFFFEGSLEENSVAKFQKFRGTDLRRYKNCVDHGIEKERATEKEVSDPVCSESGLTSNKKRVKGKSFHSGDVVFHNNLSDDLCNQSNMLSVHKLAKDDSSNGVPDMINIGPDTQMAAEAIEALCFEVNLSSSNGTGTSTGIGKDVTQLSKIARKGDALDEVLLGKKSQDTLFPEMQELKVRKSRKRRKECPNILPPNIKEQREGRLRNISNCVIEPYHDMKLACRKLETERLVVEQYNFSTPVAHRTRKHTKLSCTKAEGSKFDTGKEIKDLLSARILKGRRTATHNKNVKTGDRKNFRKVGSTGVKKSNTKCVGLSNSSKTDTVEYIELERIELGEVLDEKADEMQCSVKRKRSRSFAAGTSSGPGTNHASHSTKTNCSDISPMYWKSDEIPFRQSMDIGISVGKRITSQPTTDDERSWDDVDHIGSVRGTVKGCLNDAFEASTSLRSQGASDMKTLSSSGGAETTGRVNESPRDRCGTVSLNSTTTCSTQRNNVSPICMGNEYYNPSCRRILSGLSLMKEDDLMIDTSVYMCGTKQLRKRKDSANIKVLFSQHLDVDVVKQQKKILSRLGASEASSMLDATHFVADEFIRTRNMLEAMAFGKPVVSRIWLESCGQTGCFVNEKNYILRDARKEKEFGFCMPVSLSRACEQPLLLGQRVFVTPNTMPAKDTITTLVRAVHGLVVERLGRTYLKDDKYPHGLLILSCKEDYDICVPFLEKGGAVYSSELLLNGIVKQKLEFQRYQLFTDQVRRTRSTILVGKNQHLPLTKCN